jgi:hypothetical protein
MNVKTEFSTKRSDYAFIEDLFVSFELWFQETNPGLTTVGKSIFSRCISSLQNYNVVRVAIGRRVDNVTPRKVAVVNRKFI